MELKPLRQLAQSNTYFSELIYCTLTQKHLTFHHIIVPSPITFKRGQNNAWLKEHTCFEDVNTSQVRVER